MTTVNTQGIRIRATTQTGYVRVGSTDMLVATHLPQSVPGKATALLFCPPLGWEEACSHRVLWQWAESVAARGYPALTFDLPGTGDSADCGVDEDQFDLWCASVARAAELLRHETQASRVVAIGLGFGAMLAWASVAQGSEIDDLVIWGAPMRGTQLIRSIRSRALVLNDLWLGGCDGVIGANPGDSSGAETTSRSLRDDAGLLLRSATVDAISKLDLARLPLPEPTSRRLLLLARPSDESLRAHLGTTGSELTVGPGESYASLMHQVHRASLPKEVSDALFRWLENEPRSSARCATTRPIALSESMVLEHAGVDVRESAIAVEVSGETLRGVLAHRADAPSAEVCAVFVSGGADRRTGRGRLWVETARRWAALGVPSVRIDPPGVGDSDGVGTDYLHLRRQYLPERVDALRALLDALSALPVPRRFVLVGYCSGGWRAQQAALTDRRVAGVYALNIHFLRWSWWLAHLRSSWLSGGDRPPDETALRQRAVRCARAALRTAKPARPLLIASPIRSWRIQRTLERLRAQGTELTFVLQEDSDQFDELIDNLAAAERRNVFGRPRIAVDVVSRAELEAQSQSIQGYLQLSLDEMLERVLQPEPTDAEFVRPLG